MRRRMLTACCLILRVAPGDATSSTSGATPPSSTIAAKIGARCGCDESVVSSTTATSLASLVVAESNVETTLRTRRAAEAVTVAAATTLRNFAATEGPLPPLSAELLPSGAQVAWANRTSESTRLSASVAWLWSPRELLSSSSTSGWSK